MYYNQIFSSDVDCSSRDQQANLPTLTRTMTPFTDYTNTFPLKSTMSSKGTTQRSGYNSWSDAYEEMCQVESNIDITATDIYTIY